MLIDYMTDRFCFSNSNIALTVIVYVLAAVAAQFVYRLGRLRCERKYGLETLSAAKILLHTIPSGMWNLALFLVTGCLRSPFDSGTEDKKLNRKIYFSGIAAIACGAVASFLLYTVVQLLASLIGGVYWEIPLLVAKALTGTTVSLTVFSLLPLPGSDSEKALRTKPLSKKGEEFRKNGTWPFFLFCLLSLLLASVTVPLANGQVCSLSGIITLFPILLIGG